MVKTLQNKMYLSYLIYRAHIMIATPGRLEDLFKRKQEGFDLAASTKALVRLKANHLVP